MPDTGTAIGPCIMCWKPKLSCHIEFMDTSNVAYPKRISTSPVLRTSLWEVFKNQQHSWYRYCEWSMYNVQETKTFMSHWFHGHQRWSHPKTRLYNFCALHFTLRSVQESVTCLTQVQQLVHVLCAGNQNGHVTLNSLTPAMKPPQNRSLQLLCW
jgi:hypothetical protein